MWGDAASSYMNGAEVKWPVTSLLPLISAVCPSGWPMLTVSLSSRYSSPGPKACRAAICRMTAWIETFTPGSAMRSCAPKSLIVFTPGRFVISQTGMFPSAPSALTFRFARVRPQRVSIGPTPPAARSMLPEISASLIGGPPVKVSHSGTRSRPARLALLLEQLAVLHQDQRQIGEPELPRDPHRLGPRRPGGQQARKASPQCAFRSWPNPRLRAIMADKGGAGQTMQNTKTVLVPDFMKEPGVLILRARDDIEVVTDKIACPPKSCTASCRGERRRAGGDAVPPRRRSRPARGSRWWRGSGWGSTLWTSRR